MKRDLRDLRAPSSHGRIKRRDEKEKGKGR